MKMLWLLVIIPVAWGWYLSIMHLKSAHDQGKLTLAAKILGYPWLIAGLAFDVLFNLIVGSLLFLERPRELLFTSRVRRHATGSSRWRRRLAILICRELLDPFDPAGKHC